jgi:hypothetical protein
MRSAQSHAAMMGSSAAFQVGTAPRCCMGPCPTTCVDCICTSGLQAVAKVVYLHSTTFISMPNIKRGALSPDQPAWTSEGPIQPLVNVEFRQYRGNAIPMLPAVSLKFTSLQAL